MQRLRDACAAHQFRKCLRNSHQSGYPSPMPPPAITLVWFRHDLRLDDNPALAAAAARGAAVVPLFIWAPEEERPWPPGSASRWWLHHSLEKLSAALAKAGSPLVIRTGPSLETPAETRFLRKIGADAVGFSTVMEAIAAVHAGMRILGLSTITNINDPDHPQAFTVDDVIRAAREAAPRMASVIESVIREAANDRH